MEKIGEEGLLTGRGKRNMRAVIDELAMLERQEFWLRITFNFVGYMWIWIGSGKKVMAM